ncbi:MAG: helix-turn-helix transcriptional regulator [Lachnospiraceae bacterium]|nr:helix-turn-helix transcriptional regulator [Lachnospiraceae bacterium]
MNYATLIRSVLLQKKRFTLLLKGKSMEPTFFEGNSVVVVPAERIYIDDIILFEVRGTVVFHRVVQIFGDWIITKGDNHMYCDDMIHRSQVLGKYFNKSSQYDSPISKDNNRKITFSMHDYIVSNTTRDIIGSSSINLSTNTEISRNCLNIGVLAMANMTINDILPNIQKSENAKFHFNVKISNKKREGFYVFEDFDYVVRLCGYIPNSLLTIEQQAIMALGIINCIGD